MPTLSEGAFARPILIYLVTEALALLVGGLSVGKSEPRATSPMAPVLDADDDGNDD